MTPIAQTRLMLTGATAFTVLCALGFLLSTGFNALFFTAAGLFGLFLMGLFFLALSIKQDLATLDKELQAMRPSTRR